MHSFHMVLCNLFRLVRDQYSYIHAMQGCNIRLLSIICTADGTRIMCLCVVTRLITRQQFVHIYQLIDAGCIHIFNQVDDKDGFLVYKRGLAINLS